MKIKIYNCDEYWNYNINEYSYTQKQYDYAVKYLDFDKLDKDYYIFFNDKKTEEWFHKAYIQIFHLKTIYHQSLEGYQWLKDNWGNGMFKIAVCYQDKQKIKTIVNKIINIELIRKNNEN